jgi:uncharacterized protein YdiU (UPF0061 family)
MNVQATIGRFERLTIVNRFADALPGDPVVENARRQVVGACYSRVAPTAVRAPRLLASWNEVAALLDLGPADVASPTFVEVMSGNRLLPGMVPHATCYGGHQFGNWAGQLGDGRAINLGDVVNTRGEHWTLQLKGAGPTPYSRTADGRAVLRSSIREFLCSEAMFHLGVPTTRALALVATGEEVVRDMLYDGHPAPEPGAVVCRVAPSFTRFGHFEILAARGDVELLKRLLDFTIRADFPGLPDPGHGAPAYADWFAEVCRRTADMVVGWMRVGFVHGVMNTDNMSVLGLTIDYGPYGWLDDYDPDWTPNTTDAATRRYRFGRQPAVAQWNLLQLANAVYPLIGDAAPLEAALAEYAERYNSGSSATMARKLGLRGDGTGDEGLITELDAVLRAAETDMTLFFRALATVDPAAPALSPALLEAYYRPEQLVPHVRIRIEGWLERYAARLRADGSSNAERAVRMNRVNPKFVLRNYLAQLAIDRAAQGDDSEIHALMEVLRRPYDEQPGKERYAAKRPDWARRRAGCSMLSCSS